MAPTTRTTDTYMSELKKRGPQIIVNVALVDGREQSLKDTLARVLAAAVIIDGELPNGRKLVRFDSGNFPLYFPGQHIREVRDAMREAVDLGGEYLRGTAEAREEIARYYRVDPRHVIPIAGISNGLQQLQDLLLLGTRMRMLIPNLTYPTHLTKATMLVGGSNIKLVPRDSTTGLPDLSGYNEKNNPFRVAGFATVVTHENPLPVAHTREVYRNDGGTGLFDLAEMATMKDGIIRPIVIDMIYMSMAWGDKKLTVDDIIQLADGKHILIFMNSLSKVFLEPGARAGVMAVYVPDRLTQYAAGGLIRGLESLFDLALNPVSNVSMAGLVASHRILVNERDGMQHPTLEHIRREAQRRFIGQDGHGGNQQFMLGIPHIKALYPDIPIECSGYNAFVVEGEGLPWNDENYKETVLTRVRTMMVAVRNHEAVAAFDDYIKAVPVVHLDPSEIMVTDLLMETGILFPPIGRFYALGTEPCGMVGFRPVMIAPEDRFHQVGDGLREFFEKRIDRNDLS